MTSHRASLQRDKNLIPSDIHLLPCHIRYTGPAPVSKFFTSTDTTRSPEAVSADAAANDKVAYFRGRKLLGKTTTLPNRYQGVIYEPSPAQTVSTRSERASKCRRDATDDDDDDDAQIEDPGEMEELSVWTAKHTFSKITDYGNNVLPETKLLEWIALAQVLHGSEA